MEELKKCPDCGQAVEIHGGDEEWIPTYYDPDSGGEPYNIRCSCGLRFTIGHCDFDEFIKEWNKYANNNHR